MDRVRRDTDNEDTTIDMNMDKMIHKANIASKDQMSNHMNQADQEEEEDIVDKVDKKDKKDKVDQVSNLLPSARTIATVLRSIADAADVFGS